MASLESDELVYNDNNNTYRHNGTEIVVNDILGAIDLDIVMNFNVTGTYDVADGKFSKVLGNVVIVDCNYLHTLVFPAIKKALKPLEFTHFF